MISPRVFSFFLIARCSKFEQSRDCHGGMNKAKNRGFKILLEEERDGERVSKVETPPGCKKKKNDFEGSNQGLSGSSPPCSKNGKRVRSGNSIFLFMRCQKKKTKGVVLSSIFGCFSFRDVTG